MKNYYKISEISKLYGIGTDTVRYYEKVGILKPKRDVNGYRSYNLQDIYKLNVIRDLRELDFSTERIKEYLDFQSLDNTLSLLHEEGALLNRQLEELSLRRSAIERRIEVLKVAAAAKDGIFSLKELPPRRCVQLSEYITRDEEMDFVIKRLHRKHENSIPELGNLAIGAFLSVKEWEPGDSSIYHSVFFILEDTDLDGDFTLPGGTYLSSFYRGAYSQNYCRLQETFAHAAKYGLKVEGAPFEIYDVDNRYTARPEEFLTEIQVKVTDEE